jgi:uncharacterized protein YecE (DUF72 family)
MQTRFHIGAKSLRGGLEAYAKRFDFLEVPVAANKQVEGAKLRTDPALATLRKWRKEVPPHFDFCVVAGAGVAQLKAGEAFDRDLEAVRGAIDALQARCVLVRTPSEVTPSAVWRDRMARLLDKLPRDATHVIWEPTGLWETDEAALSAKRWGIVLSVDASRDPVPPNAVAYTRLRAMGETRSFGAAALERVVDAIGARRDAYVVFETDGALTECKRLRQLAQDAKDSGKGGMSRLIRPRGGILVRDDEQE